MKLWKDSKIFAIYTATITFKWLGWYLDQQSFQENFSSGMIVIILPFIFSLGKFIIIYCLLHENSPNFDKRIFESMLNHNICKIDLLYMFNCPYIVCLFTCLFAYLCAFMRDAELNCSCLIVLLLFVHFFFIAVYMCFHYHYV